eukprot:GHVT01071752.1.p2 GENE.GHVT01071752.1~~GHVT01071752.1.p2  ORF type:complete len:298 (+),score=39.27 GHVT01071752.1:1705-2598(+)
MQSATAVAVCLLECSTVQVVCFLRVSRLSGCRSDFRLSVMEHHTLPSCSPERHLCLLRCRISWPATNCNRALTKIRQHLLDTQWAGCRPGEMPPFGENLTRKLAVTNLVRRGASALPDILGRMLPSWILLEAHGSERRPASEAGHLRRRIARAEAAVAAEATKLRRRDDDDDGPPALSERRLALRRTAAARAEVRRAIGRGASSRKPAGRRSAGPRKTTSAGTDNPSMAALNFQPPKTWRTVPKIGDLLQNFNPVIGLSFALKIWAVDPIASAASPAVPLKNDSDSYADADGRPDPL